MNLILFDEKDRLDGARIRLAGRRARHIFEVHRAQEGQHLRVGQLNGWMGSGRVCRIAPEEVVLEVTLAEPPPPPIGVELILAMPRPKVLQRVIESIAALGIKKVALINAARVEKSYFGAPRASEAAIREALVRGLEQGRDTVLPTVELRSRFRPFVEDELASWLGSELRLVAHPVQEDTPREPALGGAGSVALAIGPEGGFVPFEIELLRSVGFQPWSLGERILRVETAVAFAVGRLTREKSPSSGAAPPRRRDAIAEDGEGLGRELSQSQLQESGWTPR